MVAIVGETFDGVEVEPLLDGHELASAALDHLLGSDAPDDPVHGTEVTVADVGEQLDQLGVKLLVSTSYFACQRQHLLRVLLVVRKRVPVVLSPELIQCLKQEHRKKKNYTQLYTPQLYTNKLFLTLTS